jgi:8-oxo-dGTP diphosphatase
MVMSHESAGGIVLNREGKMVLVHQWGNTWSFPKGGVERGESLLEAAIREIREETGLHDLSYIGSLGSYERYSIRKDGISQATELGLRRRTFFLFTTTQRELQPQDREVTEARFVTLQEALALLSHPKDREFLESVRVKIEPSMSEKSGV